MLASYLALFASAFGAATLLPMSSEAVLLALAAQGLPLLSLWAVATLGNTLGSVLNWALGRYLLHFQDRRWFPITPTQLAKAQARYQRYGTWSLLFAWLPVVGDALTLAAGTLKIRLDLFIVLVALGKGARYGVLLWVGEWAIT